MMAFGGLRNVRACYDNLFKQYNTLIFSGMWPSSLIMHDFAQ
jgi:hypothetical protein